MSSFFIFFIYFLIWDKKRFWIFSSDGDIEKSTVQIPLTVTVNTAALARVNCYS